MDANYDRKFEEMKKYIPFLESMINRLENTGCTTENPRQAQLAKIRSLRDLLLDKKKRMKMENLLKCEQVLVNLYAKVEQRDSFLDARKDIDTNLSANNVPMDYVRSKLQDVPPRILDPETLPEIARPTKTEVVCTAGSKEPALFQRRPKKASLSPIRCPVLENKISTPTSSKRNYTRVLVSPERDASVWSRDMSSNKPLFNRRSPLRSPKKLPTEQSPSRNKKGRQAVPTLPQKTSDHLKDLNITLKVPEESLSSLNTKDILTRIINCSDNDVDIDTLRGLRTQILSELKQTGTKDDISDLILKSYKNKRRKKKRAEIEEGELSDSESEAIESIYGSLVVMDKDEDAKTGDKKEDEEEKCPRKIQICLVINSEKEGTNEMDSGKETSSRNTLFGESDFEQFPGGKEIKKIKNLTPKAEQLKGSRKSMSRDVESAASRSGEARSVGTTGAQISGVPWGDATVDSLPDRVRVSEAPAREVPTEVRKTEDRSSKEFESELDNAKGDAETKTDSGRTDDTKTNAQPINTSDDECEVVEVNTNTERQLPKAFSPNFYKPISVQESANNISYAASTLSPSLNVNAKQAETVEPDVNETLKHREPVEIPLLGLEASAKQEVVQEIDILQALKKEILSEKISLADPAIETPPLHQPKLTKVENMHTMLPKKRISIERYKEKSTSAPRPSVFLSDINGNTSKDELSKKQSLKLTEKECERFNLSQKLALNESSDDEDNGKISPAGSVYSSNLAPKSPDHDDFADTGIKPPVIIPADPVKTTAACCRSDVDMRMLTVLSATNATKSTGPAPPAAGRHDKALDVPKSEAELNVTNDKRIPLLDPRKKRDFNYPHIESPNLGFLERNLRSHINFSPSVTPVRIQTTMANLTPNRSSSLVPNILPNLTSNVNIYEVSSSRQSFESDGYSNQGHVYAPIFPVLDGHDFSEDVQESDLVRNRDDLRSNGDFQNIYAENNNSPIYNLSECPQTPVHPFGVSDAPNPSHSFGRLEMPMTPIHSFGRSEAPMTPVHPFGMADCPSTPIHPFGRTEILRTPTHPFGRADFCQMPGFDPAIRYNSFQDPRMNRGADYDSLSRYNDDKCYENYNDTNFSTRNYKYEQSKRNYSDSYRNYGRQKSVGRFERSAAYEQDSRYGDRLSRHETSAGHSKPRSSKADRHFCNGRSKSYRHSDYRYECETGGSYGDTAGSRRTCRREHSVGRTLAEDKHLDRNIEKNPSDKTLSVQSHAGRPFTIDTSVNRSFQETLASLGSASLREPNFDARRKRASSVGRVLLREPSVGRPPSDFENKRHPFNSQSEFRRACSVGRETVRYDAKKNFSDIKQELQSFKETRVEKMDNSNGSSHRCNTGVPRKVQQRDPRLSRREQCDSQNGNNGSHRSALRARSDGSREPRLARGGSKHHSKKLGDPTAEKTQEIKKHGIIYSTDNIAKGTILGSGYGVKNYKIPKIKKPPEEAAGNQEAAEDGKAVNNKTINNKRGQKNTKDNKDLNTPKHECTDMMDHEKTLDEGVVIVEKNEESMDRKSRSKNEKDIDELSTSDRIEKRVTRSSRRSAVSEPSAAHVHSAQRRTVRNRKSAVLASDSEDDNVPVSNLNKKPDDSAPMGNGTGAAAKSDLDGKNSCGALHDEMHEPNADQASEAAVNEDLVRAEGHSEKSDLNEERSGILDADNCFGMELEMFSENITADPVIENINALIADLDDHLETSRNDGSRNQFTKEISLENMLDNITCVEKKDTDASYEEVKSLSETVVIDPSDSIDNKKEKVHRNVDLKIEHNNEVTTTEQELPLVLPESTTQSVNILESCSTPDSTIDISRTAPEGADDASADDGAADSTQQLTCGGAWAADVTTTHCSSESKDTAGVNSSSREIPQPSDSIGSLLSILKDKSKIKELLTMLKDQSSENEKLKKKLEKLSEIVSDDDDNEDLLNIVSSTPRTLNNTLSTDNRGDVCQDKVTAVEYLRNSANISCEEITNSQKAKSDDSVQSSNRSNTIFNDQVEHFKKESIEVTPIIVSEEISEEFEKRPENVDVNVKDDDEKIGETSSIAIESGQSEMLKKTPNSIKSKKGKAKVRNNKFDENKRSTRSDPAGLKTEKTAGSKIPSRELKQLQEDIKEMFMHDDVFSVSGIRMCRLAKLVEEKTHPQDKAEEQSVESSLAASSETFSRNKIPKKRNISKSKTSQKNASVDTENSNESSIPASRAAAKFKPGPKLKTKAHEQNDLDPYLFESDSISEPNHANASDNKLDTTSESESDSLGSARSFGSMEHMAESKKRPKRKRRGWQTGVIKSKSKRKKMEATSCEAAAPSPEGAPEAALVADTDCFTDVTYCFHRNVTSYACRICSYGGSDIVQHYRKQHPHSEIPLSRMSPEVAKEAIEQSEEINPYAISKMPTDKYICRFCFKEFSRKKTILEAFFWHVVSMHTGEYKQHCTECENTERCPSHLDVPPPPKELKGQLLGFICGKCNFTQISLENLKTHFIRRHNNEQTEVRLINLAAVSKAAQSSHVKPAAESELRRSKRLVHTPKGDKEEIDANDKSDVPTDIDATNTKRNRMQSQITFENDEDEASELNRATHLKLEPVDETELESVSQCGQAAPASAEAPLGGAASGECGEPPTSNDVLDYPHFKVKRTETGTKEYVCCINGTENHYRTALLISFKKHVQIKHTEKWDGFCFLCRVIVTPQGVHCFKDCLQHFLDKHIDEFPLMQQESTQLDSPGASAAAWAPGAVPSKNYLNVRPLAELVEAQPALDTALPVIESVISLGAPREGTSPHATGADVPPVCDKQEVYKYEEAQARVMSKKYTVVAEIMMRHEKLVHVFKCAGRFCSYSTDNAEEALRHAVVHERVGGEDSLVCAYCDFDSSRNAVDLVTHVFNIHGGCPFACARCFYRAAASQLVNAHALRAHGAPGPVLRSSAASRPAAPGAMLPRDVAVPFYMCNQLVGEEQCKFKTYTSGKFCEHLRSKHQADAAYSCFRCPAAFPKHMELLQHMKRHGFKLYQCAWCVHGADTEADMLAHGSESHPNKQPQAYLRVITNKEGTTGYRVLPLAHLDNSKIATVDTTPSNVKGNPEREAERSIDLEKLIGQTTQMIESIAPTAQSEGVANQVHGDAFGPHFTPPPLDQTQESLVLALQSSLLTETQDAASSPSPAGTRRPETPVLMERSVESDVHKQLTPILKVESALGSPNKKKDAEIVCLDSDDESSHTNEAPATATGAARASLSLVGQNKPNEQKLVPLSALFKCGLCERVVLKNAVGFKKHVAALHAHAPELPCAHCTFRAARDDLIKHYATAHSGSESTRYVCGICGNKYVSFLFVKKHIRETHNSTKLLVTSKTVTDGEHQFVVEEAVKNKKPSKRKRTTDNEDRAPQSAPKVKKFAPDDINLLPINPILDDSVHCALCEFSTKVRLNMVRHLQLHAEQQPVPQTAPVNPVPHLETNEKHFDKMLNLASSSVASRMDRSGKPEPRAAPSAVVPPEAAARYPKYVPERQRYTCGANGCCYISVDEVMLKYHWETLHSGTNDFHCVHCPPYQHLNTSKQLTASRIIGHLKMHDVRLYACSSCPYYHHRRQMVDKHITEFHNTGHVMTVREDANPPAGHVAPAPGATPTMDLKPWQCGLCKFKSMLRPEVVEHCAKIHQSKMQYKCTYCAFRASTLESVPKHQRNAHPDKALDTFYFYYREDSLPSEPDGTPRWQKQRQLGGAPEAQVKSEVVENAESESQSHTSETDPPPPPVVVVDLNIVKQDPDLVATPECSLQDLCQSFGQFCEPNGLKYKCPLCKIVSEESRDAMLSHLYEELQYRKWECGFCAYKAFHKNGLNEHMLKEHHQNREPIELPVDSRVEAWIAKALDHQFLLIEKNRQNLANQKTGTSPDATPPASTPRTVAAAAPEPVNHYTLEDLQNSFGKFGASDDKHFKCPKCNTSIMEESLMRDHLEMELTKIRWCCNSCAEKFQNYHEAQFHCKTEHAAPARPVEAVRDMGMRCAWIAAVVEAQRLGVRRAPEPAGAAGDAAVRPEHGEPPDDSLLVVRYEEGVPTPELLAPILRPTAVDSDEDEEKLVIDLPSQNTSKVCPFCLFVVKEAKDFKDHVAQHDHIKPYFCSACDFNSYRKAVLKHIGAEHAGQLARLVTRVQRSRGPPLRVAKLAAEQAVLDDDSGKLVCLNCEKSFTEHDSKSHTHDSARPAFAKKGQIVVKCCLCLRLHESVDAATAHHRTCHPADSLNYAFYKLHHNKRSLYCCSYCEQSFKFWKDLKVHCKATHGSAPLQYSKRLFCGAPCEAPVGLSAEDGAAKRRSDGAPGQPARRMCARKSTAKLPYKAVAKKSTTKLPHTLEPEPEPEPGLGEFSFYGSRAPPHAWDHVRASLTFGSADVSFSFKQLSEVIQINPTVLVEDVAKKRP